MSEPQRVDFLGIDRAWPLIDTLFTRMQELPESGTPRTNLAPRQVDLAQPAGHRVYIQAHALLGFAYEHHQAFLAHIDKVGFGPRAPFNLLRPVLESSLWALWLLDPQDSATRRQRALQYEIHDFKAEISYFDELGKRAGGLPMREAVAERQARVGKVYRDEAAQMRLDYAQLKKAKINLTDEILKMERLLTLHGMDTVRLIVAEWRRLSGYQHGKVWPVALGSDQTVLAKIPGGQTVHLTASNNSISLATGLSALVFIAALSLYIERCENPAG